MKMNMEIDQDRLAPSTCIEHLFVARDMAADQDAQFLLYLIDMALLEASKLGGKLEERVTSISAPRESTL